MYKAFSGELAFLSNFYTAPVTYEGEFYPTVEHAYQAAKATDLATRKAIQTAARPGLAKRLGKHCAKRPDWEEVKVGIMHDLLRQKFAAGSLRAELLATDQMELVEENSWGDTFWGRCNGVGKNTLGELLMKVRTELKSAT